MSNISKKRSWLSNRVTVAAVSGVVLSMMTVARVSLAQEAMQTAWSEQESIESQRKQLESMDYTYKQGTFKLLITPSMKVQYDDNVNLVESGQEQDFILSPGVNFDAHYPMSDYNILNLSAGVEYDEYIEHSHLSHFGLNSASGTQLSYGFTLKDFAIEAHDRIQYIDSSGGSAASSPGAAADVANANDFRTINNTVGFLLSEDLRNVVLRLGYDHLNVWSVGGGGFNSLNRSAEMITGSAGLRLDPRLVVALDGSATFTRYDETILNNNNNYSAGVHAEFTPSDVLKITPRVGYTITDFQQTSSSISTANVGTYYFDLTVNHEITKFAGYQVSVGRETQAGFQSDLIEDYYARGSVHWSIIRDLGFVTSASYEHGTQGVGNISGNLSETFDYVVGGVNLTYPIAKRLTSGLSYQITVRSSSTSGRGYTQNVVGLNLSYRL